MSSLLLASLPGEFRAYPYVSLVWSLRLKQEEGGWVARSYSCFQNLCLEMEVPGQTGGIDRDWFLGSEEGGKGEEILCVRAKVFHEILNGAQQRNWPSQSGSQSKIQTCSKALLGPRHLSLGWHGRGSFQRGAHPLMPFRRRRQLGVMKE